MNRSTSRQVRQLHHDRVRQGDGAHRVRFRQPDDNPPGRVFDTLSVVAIAATTYLGALVLFRDGGLETWIVAATGSTTWATIVLAAFLLLGVGLMTRIPGALADR